MQNYFRKQIMLRKMSIGCNQGREKSKLNLCKDGKENTNNLWNQKEGITEKQEAKELKKYLIEFLFSLIFILMMHLMKVELFT